MYVKLTRHDHLRYLGKELACSLVVAWASYFMKIMLSKDIMATS